MKLVDQLEALATAGYGFQVYGRGEFEADCMETNPTLALDHIEAQDECSVYLWANGMACGVVEVVGDEGEFTIYDYGSGDKNLMEFLGKITQED